MLVRTLRSAAAPIDHTPGEGPDLVHEVDLGASNLPTTKSRLLRDPRRNPAGALLPLKNCYWMWSPEIARAMISCWISEVPSKIVKIFESRCQRSTGYSRT